MKRIGVGYLGGHPAAKDQEEFGMLDVTDDGGIRYSAMKRVNMMERPVDLFTVPGPAISEAALAVGAKVKRGGRVFAYAMGGVVGLAAHQARVAAFNTPIAVTFEHGGKQCVAHFAAKAGEAAQWLAELEAARHGAGLTAPASSGPPPPPPPTGAPPSVADELLKLAQLRDAGVLTEDEFAAQKARVLSGG